MVMKDIFITADVINPDYAGGIHMVLRNTSSSHEVQKHE
jgi:hypothetical protein